MARAHISTAKRQAVIARAIGRCEYCQSRADFATETFAVEHIIPISLNGSDELDNLALACSGCNGFKHKKIEGYDATTGDMATLFHPRKDLWINHFAWSDDYTHVLGITPIGRATVTTLQMNRLGLVNIRSALLLIRKHPPEVS